MGHVSCRVWPQEEGVTEVMPALFPRGLAGTASLHLFTCGSGKTVRSNLL